MLILSGITAAQIKMSGSKRGSYAIRIGNSNTAANIHDALLPLLTYYKGVLAHCKQALDG